MIFELLLNLGQTLIPLFFSQLQGIAVLIKSILENVARSVKHTSLEFTLLSERMAHFEKLLVFLDSQIHSLNAQSKAVMGSIMKVSLENKAAMSRLADVMVNMTQEFVKAQTAQLFILSKYNAEIFRRRELKFGLLWLGKNQLFCIKFYKHQTFTNW